MFLPYRAVYLLSWLCRVSFQALKTVQSANKRQVSATTKGPVPRLNKQFISPPLLLLILFISLFLSPPPSSSNPCLSCFFFFLSFLAWEEICTLAMFFPCDHRMLWNRLAVGRSKGWKREGEKKKKKKKAGVEKTHKQVTEVISVSRGIRWQRESDHLCPTHTYAHIHD